MMPYANQYAPSSYGYQQPAWGAPQAPQARMQGSVLVLSKHAQMPQICAKCGVQHGLTARHTKMSWVPGWAYAMVVFGWAIGLIIMAVTRKTAQVTVPVCDSCNKRWSQGNLFFGLSFLPAAFLYLLMIVFAGVDLPDAGAACMLLGTLALLVAPIVVAFAVKRPRAVYPDKIDDHFVYLKGVHTSAAAVACGAPMPEAQAPAQPSFAPAQPSFAPAAPAPYGVPQQAQQVAPYAAPAINAPGAYSQPPPAPPVNAPGAYSQPPAAPAQPWAPQAAPIYPPTGYNNNGYN